MPEDRYSYKIEPWRSGFEHGYRLHLLKNAFEAKRGGIFTPNGGGVEAMRHAKDRAYEAGRVWIENNHPGAIPF